VNEASRRRESCAQADTGLKNAEIDCKYSSASNETNFHTNSLQITYDKGVGTLLELCYLISTMAAEDITASILLIYGAFLVWGGLTAIRVFTGLVQPVRPASFVALRLTSVWSVGLVSALLGFTLVTNALGMYS
jgi:hypothetical protein